MNRMEIVHRSHHSFSQFCPELLIQLLTISFSMTQQQGSDTEFEEEQENDDGGEKYTRLHSSSKRRKKGKNSSSTKKSRTSSASKKGKRSKSSPPSVVLDSQVTPSISSVEHSPASANKVSINDERDLDRGHRHSDHGHNDSEEESDDADEDTETSEQTSEHDDRKNKKSRARTTISSKSKPVRGNKDHYSDEDMATMEQKQQKLEQELDKLRKKNQKLAAMKELDDTKVTDGDPVVALVKTACSQNIWRQVKFVTKPADEIKITGELVLDSLVEQGILEALTPELREHWIRKYAPAVVKQINYTRSYVLARLKDCVFSLLDALDQKLEKNNQGNPKAEPPSLERILACLTRTTTNKDDFDWYWDSLITAATGNRHHWCEDHRYFETISVAAPKDDPKAFYIPTGTEAFTVAAYECFHKAWHNMWLLKKKYPKATLVPCKSEGKDSDYELKNNKLYLYDRKYKGLWTVSDGGQAKYGGWSRDGIYRWVALRKMNREARATDATTKMEEECLERLRQKHGIIHATPEDHKRAKNSKSAPTSANDLGEELEINIFDDDDDE